MKTLITTFVLLLGLSFSYSQVPGKAKTSKKATIKMNQTMSNTLALPNSPVKKCTFSGDFKITDFAVLKLKTPTSEKLQQLLYSTVKIPKSSLAGSEIDLISFNLKSSEIISRTDYITNTFGREIRAQEPDLPNDLLVHYTDNELCIGIVEIDTKHIAIPYQGVLLF